VLPHRDGALTPAPARGRKRYSCDNLAPPHFLL
jgi:hypothetical protein